MRGMGGIRGRSSLESTDPIGIICSNAGLAALMCVVSSMPGELACLNVEHYSVEGDVWAIIPEMVTCAGLCTCAKMVT